MKTRKWNHAKNTNSRSVWSKQKAQTLLVLQAQRDALLEVRKELQAFLAGVGGYMSLELRDGSGCEFSTRHRFVLADVTALLASNIAARLAEVERQIQDS